jgi:hypothetical protein
MRPLLVTGTKGAKGKPGATGPKGGRRALRVTPLRVTRVTDVWEIVDEWWRDRPIARRYFTVTLEDGTRTTLFRDLSDGGWYAQRP